jgi:hypothetical protein
MDEFNAIFREATANVSADYFRLPVVDSPAVYRERLYCYELYHQLRLRWPTESRYRLNGEIDKRSHRYFAEDAWAPKPDFLIHVPGSDDNSIVIVKTVDNLRNNEVLKDLDTLNQFMERAGYRRGIHLVFGTTAAATLDVLQRAGLDINQLRGVELWGHSEVGLPAERAA